MSEVTADWIALDWGTSNLRAWAMSSSGTVLAESTSDRGMGRLSPEQFPKVLDEVLRDWTCEGPVVACGMVGARQGWIEAPYAEVPCTPHGQGTTKAPGARDVHILPGLSQKQPPDVMRGEETQIAGFLALNPNWDGVICLPGTHSKWAQVSAGEVVSFQTFMTGELFALLSEASVLRHSVASGWDDEAFGAAVGDGISNPERLAARLFSLRAGDLLEGTASGVLRARLSGLLVGAELAAARPYWLGQQVAVLGAGPLTASYVRALSAQGVPATEAEASRMTLAGLTSAYRKLKGTLA